MSVWSDLLFGDGFWLGLLLVQAIGVTISSIENMFAYMACIFNLCLFVVYLEEIGTTTFNTWGIMITLVSAIFFLLMGLSDK